MREVDEMRVRSGAEAEELPELPVGWAWVRLADVAALNPGLGISPGRFSDDLEVSFVPMKAVEEETGQLDASDGRPLGQVRKGHTAFRDGDILFAKITPSMENGKIAVAQNLRNGIGFGTTEFHVMRPANGLEVGYLLRFVARREFRSEAADHMTGTVGQRRVPVDFLATSYVPMAPVNEQRRIVTRLEELLSGLEVGISRLKHALAKLKRYRQAVLKAAVEGELSREWREAHGGQVEPASELLERILKERHAKWEAEQEARGRRNAEYREPRTPNASGLWKLPEGWVWASVSQLTLLTTSGSRNWSQHCADDGSVFIRAQDIRRDRLDLADVAHVQVPSKAEGTRTKVQRMDVLVTITGANVTKSALVEVELAEAYVSQHVALVRPTLPEIAPHLYSWIIAPTHGRGQLESAAYGAGKPGLNLDSIREVAVALPSLDEQRSIAAEVSRRMSEADCLERSLAANLTRAGHLRQAILKRAFSGELVPQDPNDEPASVLLERIQAEREKTPAPKRRGHKHVQARPVEEGSDA